jgi:hypothetical protein
VWDRRLYRWMTDDDGEQRACDAISDAACRAAPRSFILNAANGACTKLAEQLASPGLVLAWLLETVGAPVAMSGWLEPLRRGGSLVPQLAVSAWIRSRPVRKWFWVAAGTIQAVALLAMAAAAVGLEGTVGGLAVLAALTVFSVASGIGSVAFGDVLGKTVPKGRRGQLLAARATVGGALTLAAGLVLRFVVGEDAGVGLYAVLITAAAVLWAVAAALFAMMPEEPGATEHGRNALTEAREGVSLVAQVPGFGRYLSARALLLAVELSIPWYAVHARRLGLEARDLGLAIVAVGLANLVSSPVWGRLADRVSSRRVMVLAGGIGIATAAVAVCLDIAFGSALPAIAYAPVLFAAGMGIAGVRLGRKTWLVDFADAPRRPLFVAVSNTLIGGVTFAYGGLGFVGDAIGVRPTVAVLGVLAAAGTAAAWWMPEASEGPGR